MHLADACGLVSLVKGPNAGKPICHDRQDEQPMSLLTLPAGEYCSLRVQLCFHESFIGVLTY